MDKYRLRYVQQGHEMDTFGFTKKKLLSLDPEKQNRHIIAWLSRFYQKLTTNHVTPDGFDLFARQYNDILCWTGMKPFIRPDSSETRIWIETISNQIHYHRPFTGQTVRDHELLERVRTTDLPFLPGSSGQIDFKYHVALDGVRSLFNVGSIFRTCDAAGARSLILGNTPGKEHPKVRKTAMGAHEWIEQEKTDDLACTLWEKKEKGFHVVGVETIEDAHPFYDMSWENNTIVVFGNEEYGISTHVRQTCDNFVYIPMFGRKNSLNIANAVSIICFQIAMSASDCRLCR